MHSRIYQLSTERLPQHEWLTENDISPIDIHSRFTDYVAECPERRDEFLENIADALPKEVFHVNGDCITIIANPAVLWDKYKADFISLLQNMEFESEKYDATSWRGLGDYYLCRKANRIIDIDSLFYIMDWDESNGLVSFAYHLWKKGERVIYINGILDYHF